MSRQGGSARADWDTSYMDDAKVKALWRILEPDVATMCECLIVHEATVLATWREGRRVPVSEALPLWFPAPVSPRILELLIRVRMLDSAHKVPVKSWKGWIEPALERIAAASEAGRKAGLASGEARRQKSAGRERSFNGIANPLNPTNQPTNQPSTPRGRAGARGAAQPSRVAEGDFAELMAANGFSKADLERVAS